MTHAVERKARETMADLVTSSIHCAPYEAELFKQRDEAMRRRFRQLNR